MQQLVFQYSQINRLDFVVIVSNSVCGFSYDLKKLYSQISWYARTHQPGFPRPNQLFDMCTKTLTI